MRTPLCRWLGIGGLVLTSLVAAPRRVQGIDLLALQGLPNRQCVSFRVLGPCLCGTPPVPACLRLQYWEPAWLVETVKRPGHTQLGVLVQTLSQIVTSLGLAFELGGGGAGNVPGADQTNLHFNEAHVLPFPQFFPGPCDQCVPPDLPEVLQVHYVSEVDPLWRFGVSVPNPVALLGLGRLGVWAPLYPRVGFSITGSEPVGSGIAAARALDIAHNPTGTAPVPEVHPVLTPSGGTSPCCQLARPVQTDCFPVGTNPTAWETGTVSPAGEYIWLFWRQRTCCVDPATPLCGIAQIGGTGANQCAD
jgi:hypothetical protein